MVIPACVFGRQILENVQSELVKVFQVKPLTLCVISNNNKIQALKKKIDF